MAAMMTSRYGIQRWDLSITYDETGWWLSYPYGLVFRRNGNGPTIVTEVIQQTYSVNEGGIIAVLYRETKAKYMCDYDSTTRAKVTPIGSPNDGISSP